MGRNIFVTFPNTFSIIQNTTRSYLSLVPLLDCKTMFISISFLEPQECSYIYIIMQNFDCQIIYKADLCIFIKINYDMNVYLIYVIFI